MNLFRVQNVHGKRFLFKHSKENILNYIQLVVSVFFGLFLCACDNPKNYFIKQCRDGGGSKRACTCVYEDLERQYGKEKFSKILDNDYRNIDLDLFQKNSIEAAYRCTGLEIK